MVAVGTISRCTYSRVPPDSGNRLGGMHPQIAPVTRMFTQTTVATKITRQKDLRTTLSLSHMQSALGWSINVTHVWSFLDEKRRSRQQGGPWGKKGEPDKDRGDSRS